MSPRGPAAPPCRLHVIRARSAPVALILRRGPSGWYHLIRWATDTDVFEHGAWFRGRIYEERCGLSPDGELFVYFALQARRWQTSYKGSWTAVSRPPWLHALGLWPQGHTWSGGGAFLTHRTLALWACDLRAHPDHPGTGLEVVAGRPDARDALRALDGGLQSGEWIDGDLRASEGRLYRTRDGSETMIADFNGLTPDPQPAPDWACAAIAPRNSRAGRRGRRRR